jgi:hypothetical protein
MSQPRGISGRRFLLWAALSALVAAVAGVAVVAWLAGDGDEAPPEAAVLVADAASPVALVALSDGGLRYGERRTGRIREVDPGGRLRPEPVATVAVRAEPGQRGLLGVAVDGESRTFAAWTRASDGRIVVGQVAPGAPRLVWVGPPSTDLANGGHLAVAPDGRLVIGIGDLQDPERLDDPDAPNGKLLALDPDARPGQRPEPLSSGWNNPFAFAFSADGALWVADNAPGEQPERIGRGDRDGLPRTELDGRAAPAALVALADDRLGLCGYVSGRLSEVRIQGDRAEAPGATVAEPCRTGAAVLADGRIVVATDDALLVVGS